MNEKPSDPSGIEEESAPAQAAQAGQDDPSPLSLSKGAGLAAISNLTNPATSEQMGGTSTIGDYSDFLAEDQRAAIGHGGQPNIIGGAERPEGVSIPISIATPEMSAKTFDRFLQDPNFVGMENNDMMSRAGLTPLPAEVGASFAGSHSPSTTAAIGRGMNRPLEDNHQGLGPSLVMGDDIMGQYAKFFDPSIANEGGLSKTLSTGQSEWDTSKANRSPIMAKQGNIVLPPGRKPISSQFGMEVSGDTGDSGGPPGRASSVVGNQRKVAPKKAKSSKSGASPPKPPSVGKTIKKGADKSVGALKGGKRPGDGEDADSESFEAFEDMCSIGSKEKLSVDERKRRRAESNRLSAERSRERRKLYLKNLESAMNATQTENSEVRAKLTFYQQQINVLQEIIHLQGTSEQKVAADAVTNALRRYQTERPLRIAVNAADGSGQQPSALNSPITPASLGSSSPPADSRP